MSPTPNPGPDAHAIFLAAVERLVPEERAAFLDEACAGRPALRAAVDALLEDYKERSSREAATANLSTVPKAPLSEGAGSTVGRYKLLQKIGEGGCGVVFMAEQTEPVHRRVALKIIRLGMDTEEVVARFEAERQALAMMEHPNIAQVLDAGATPAGRPYFVMELVRGVPITKFCDDHQLSTEARLKLFIQVCQAVQHAHQKGVIHRDLKPSNILVTLHDGVPVPKVIDFGIAKATAGRLTDKTLFTAFEQFVGTPAYMSPEQAEMTNLDVDTRSDVYSLGVLLYELLTGQPPLDPDKLQVVGVDEIRRQIREVEAVRPSAQLSTLGGDALTTRARLRGTEAPRLVSLVRGDLDWIVMRCLEKDRRRRYDSASALAEDIARHLRNEPIAARPPGRLYHLQKLARRHRTAFVSVTAVVLALVIGFGAALRSYFNEAAAHQLAEEQRLRADLEAAEARKAQTEAQEALNRADYLVALDLIRRDRDAEAVAHLIRVLRKEPDRASATLLASVLTSRAWLVPLTTTTTRLATATPPRGGQRGGQRGGAAGANRGARAGRVAPGAVPFPNVVSPDLKWTLRRQPLDNAPRLYESNSGTAHPVAEPMREAGDVSAGSFAADGRHLTLTTREYDAAKRPVEQQVEVWDFPANPARLLALPEAGAPNLAIWSADGRMIFTATEGTGRIWDAGTGNALGAPMAHDQPVREAVFSPDGNRLVTVTQDNTLRVWDAASGQPLTAAIPEEARPGGAPGAGNGLGPRGQPGPPGTGAAPGRGGQANQREIVVNFSPDGRRLLVAGAGRQARVLDSASGQAMPEFQRLGTPISAVFSPDGKRLVTATNTGATGVVRLWDAATGESGLTFKGDKDPGPFNSVAFSPDGKLVVTASTTGVAHVWDAGTGEVVSNAMILGENNLWATFSPDGKKVLTYARGQEPAARVWDTAGDAISALIQPETPSNAFSAAFSPDPEGRWVVTRGTGARLWDAASGLPVSVALPGERVAFHPDGKKLLITGAEGGAEVVLFAGDIGPAWMLDLAETLARCQLDRTDTPVFPQESRSIEALQRDAMQEKDVDQPMVIWARHLLGLTP
jgi:serine/threonine protein kinase/WD40 repeat protein